MIHFNVGDKVIVFDHNFAHPIIGVVVGLTSFGRVEVEIDQNKVFTYWRAQLKKHN